MILAISKAKLSLVYRRQCAWWHAPSAVGQQSWTRSVGWINADVEVLGAWTSSRCWRPGEQAWPLTSSGARQRVDCRPTDDVGGILDEPLPLTDWPVFQADQTPWPVSRFGGCQRQWWAEVINIGWLPPLTTKAEVLAGAGKRRTPRLLPQHHFLIRSYD